MNYRVTDSPRLRGWRARLWVWLTGVLGMEYYVEWELMTWNRDLQDFDAWLDKADAK